LADGRKVAHIIHIDHFGNLITDICNDELPQDFELEINGTKITRSYVFFAQAEVGELFAIRGSAGYVEIAIREDSATARLAAKRGQRLLLKIRS
jgi:hypothetical protein